jgi:diguanylate cyclase (GGDEF)-like protein
MSAANIDPALMRKSELFSSLRQDEIDFVISYSDTLNLPKKDLLFSSGEKASHIYILTSGEIRVYKQNSDGSEEAMARFTSGDIIGEFDFVRGAEYDAYAEAAKNSQLIVFPGFGFTIDSLAQKLPHMVCGIQLNAIMMMTGRIKSIRKLILENMSWVKELHRRAYEDPGTGLWKQVLINDDIKNVLTDPAALIMLKPDRFKILVDSRGHGAGDEAMVRIATILKNFSRRLGQGWPLRFKSNEVGIIINNSDFSFVEKAAAELAASIAAMEPVPAQGEIPEFTFSATVAWALWANDDPEWDSLLQGTYAALLNAWQSGGGRIVHYSKAVPS